MRNQKQRVQMIANKHICRGIMKPVLLFDLAFTMLYPIKQDYSGELNALHKTLSEKGAYDFFSQFYLDEDMLAKIREVKPRYETFIFTSGTIQNAPELKPKLDLIFPKIFSASEMGFSKQDPKAYKQIVLELAVNGEEITFIDDSLANITAARTAGLNIYHHKSSEDTQKYLSKLI